MKDERIQTTVNRIAARVFAIWFLLMLMSLIYRTLILKQHIRDYWDIAAIFWIGALYGFIARANKGVLAHSFKRRWLTIGIVGGIAAGIAAVISFFSTWQSIAGQMPSVVYVGLFLIIFLISFLSGLGLAIGIAHFLNRRWKRKEGIEDEK